MRGLLLLGFVVALVGTLVAGSRVVSDQELTHDLSSGRVAAVTVIGDPMAQGDRGLVELTIRWRDGLERKQSLLVEQRPLRQTVDASGRRHVRDVDEHLRNLHPGVAIEHSSGRDESVPIWTRGDDSRGWAVPSWLGFLWLGVWLGCLLVIIGGPQPWRATRWAWFWLLWVPVFGQLALLVLGGPTPGLAHRRGDDPHRLTGGWAFLIAALAGGLVSTTLGLS